MNQPGQIRNENSPDHLDRYTAMQFLPTDKYTHHDEHQLFTNPDNELDMNQIDKKKPKFFRPGGVGYAIVELAMDFWLHLLMS